MGLRSTLLCSVFHMAYCIRHQASTMCSGRPILTRSSWAPKGNVKRSKQHILPLRSNTIPIPLTFILGSSGHAAASPYPNRASRSASEKARALYLLERPPQLQGLAPQQTSQVSHPSTLLYRTIQSTSTRTKSS